MSTNDVPGANPVNGDVLHVGCWAEHKDGSLIFVEGVESDRVVYSVFDSTKTPIIEYRDAMTKSDFEQTFTFGKKCADKWTWHDKSPFPWNKVIKAGAKDGVKNACVEDTLTVAQRIAENRKLIGHRYAPEKDKHMVEEELPEGTTGDVVQYKILKALNRLNKGMKKLFTSRRY